LPPFAGGGKLGTGHFVKAGSARSAQDFGKGFFLFPCAPLPDVPAILGDRRIFRFAVADSGAVLRRRFFRLRFIMRG